MTVQAKDVMTTRVVTVDLDTPVVEIAKRLMQSRISAVPVVDAEGRPIGVVSEGDLMRRPETGGERHPSWWLRILAEPETQAREYVKSHGGRARDVMTGQLVTVTEDASLEEIATLLEKHRIKRVPVVRAGKLVGIVSRANLLRGIVARQRGPQPSADDRALRVRVTEAIRASGARSEFADAVVSGGVVHLWGATYSQAERDAIHVAAANVEGVKGVEGQVGVFPPMVRSTLWAE
jgi:CBS domain-containing protein